MRPSRRRRVMLRLARLESCEPRIVLSAATAQLTLDYAYSAEQTLDEYSVASITASALAGTRNRYGLLGEGQTVAVIDSGIAYDHKALGGGLGAGYRVVGGYDFAESDTNPYDDGPAGAHGTHVAGIIASSDPVYSGVAPGVDLVSLRVFDDNGAGTMAGVEAALRWVHNNRLSFENPITTVNLSLGVQGNGTSPPSGAILEDELAQLRADGIFISVAAGNSFTTYQTAGLSYPAASPYVVPVSSVDANGNLSSFSQRDQRAIAAPGRNITSTVPDYLGNGNGVADDFARFSGTSMAAPYVAGAAVLMREAYQRAGVVGINQDALYSQMVNTADTVFDSTTGQSYLRLNLTRAIDAVMLYGAGSPDTVTPGLYNPRSGTFYLRNSSTSGTANSSFTFGKGSSGWVAMVGDWNGDGVDTVGLYNPATSTFYLRNTNSAGAADVVFNFGFARAGWQPIVGDFNGDGVDTVGLYNAATSTFYVRNTNSAGAADVTFAYGSAGAGWQAIVGDWNGDGVDTVGLYNPTSSSFYLKNSLRAGYADVSFSYGAARAGWIPVAGDFNGDGLDTVGLYSSTSSVFYLRNSNSSGYADKMFAFGAAGAGWRPLVGSWDGRSTQWGGTETASLATSGQNLSGLGSSELYAAAADTSITSAVAQAIASFHADEASPLAASSFDRQAQGEPGPGIDPRVLEAIDVGALAERELGTFDQIDEIDLTALSRAQDQPAGAQLETDHVFAGEGLLDALA